MVKKGLRKPKLLKKSLYESPVACTCSGPATVLRRSPLLSTPAGFWNLGTMTRKTSICGICENSNLASICTVCVNYRLNSYGTNLTSLKSRRDSLYSKLSEVLVAKGKADDQLSWKVLQHEKLATLREKLHFRKEQLIKDKAKVEKMASDLKVRYEMLESAMNVLERNRKEQLEKYYPNLICTQSLGHMAITSERLHKQSVVIKQICKLFPQRKVNIDGERKDASSGQYDQICNARLPRGLDPHSVPSDELAASLGYMVQLLNLIVYNVGAPALHNTGFAQGSCSRIWQRDSYWDARPSSRSNEYPLFIPRQNFCTTGVETSWSDRSSSNFGVASMESERKHRLDSSSSSSFNYTLASPHSVETHMDLQKGISLLKKSVACVTAYCYNSLCLEVPAEASTFEAFAKLLAMLSSSKEVRTAVSLKMACSRSSKQVQQLNYSVWNVNSAISSSTLLESRHTSASMQRSRGEKSLSSSGASYLYGATDNGKNEMLTEGWDLVEHPTLPPPPSQTEDVEHWTRAMFIDATTNK
ncbi:UV radiation resistance protein/autophagy-related protein 14 [Cynara cardunculus var. scolymus]|uniref:UV radiation resistance protein/autophagy-related protein 14 n=1 Tax=Cynara cardunculus var. scolymus TaxID=59895 RepID=A0A118JZQ6_CYNCS|nr:UV radiation resistance protein/autophagy-related protein 14 [Cynara cardunculus var. scolymus]